MSILILVGAIGLLAPRRGRVGRGVLAAVLLSIAFPFGPCSSVAAAATNPLQATNSRESRDDALRSIPLRFTRSGCAGKSGCGDVQHQHLSRLPVRVTDCDPDLFAFLVRHPDVVVNIWEVLGVSQVHARQVQDGKFRVADNSGTTGTLEILYQSQDTVLVYARGQYEGILSSRPAHGSCLLILKSGYVREKDGRWFVTTRLDAFLNLEPGALELLTKTLQPLVGPVADANFTQTIGFVGSLSHSSAVNPRGMQRLSAKLSHISPEVRQQFADIADRVARKAVDYPSSSGMPAGGPAMASRFDPSGVR